VAKEQLARKRPDVKIVGDDLHPLGQVRDFSPYIAKMRAANADTIITGNWGPDLALLVRAARDAGLNANFYTYYGGVIGTPTAIGPAGENRMRMVAYWHPNIEGFPGEKQYLEFKKRFGEEYYGIATYAGITLMADAMKRTKSTDPLRVAYAMEGARLRLNGEVEMRAPTTSCCSRCGSSPGPRSVAQTSTTSRRPGSRGRPRRHIRPMSPRSRRAAR
jgi:branched-chain amino acid transport system substrate-binding protein